MRRIVWMVLLAVGLALPTGCTASRQNAGARSDPAPPRSTASVASEPPTETPAPPTETPATPTATPAPTAPPGCPVTNPAPVSPAGAAPGAMFGQDSGYGNGSLWVGALWANGVIVADPQFVDDKGMVAMKFGWWRGVSGQLKITGRRLDGPAAPAIGHVPDGYGDSGFQASGVTFPVPGCWEITGTVGTASLTFVTFVVKTA
jgi:hypothetical protein